MKEAIGTSFVFNLMMIFLSLFIVILIGSISFSKGFKIRNRIIDRIEEHQGFNGASSDIETDLKAIGYKIVEKQNCKDIDGATLLTDNYNDYNYCVYEFKTSRGNYYGVKVFISFEIPLIGSYINIPLYGETRIIYSKGEIEG